MEQLQDNKDDARTNKRDRAEKALTMVSYNSTHRAENALTIIGCHNDS